METVGIYIKQILLPFLLLLLFVLAHKTTKRKKKKKKENISITNPIHYPPIHHKINSSYVFIVEYVIYNTIWINSCLKSSKHIWTYFCVYNVLYRPYENRQKKRAWNEEKKDEICKYTRAKHLFTSFRSHLSIHPSTVYLNTEE